MDFPHSPLISPTRFSLFDKLVGFMHIQIKVKASVNLSDRQLGLVAYGEAGWTASRGLGAQKERAKGERLVCGVKEKHRKREGETGPQAACPVFVYNKKPLFDVAAEPLLQTRLLLLQDVLWVRCQTQNEDWKTCTPRKALRTLESYRSSALMGRSSPSS